METGFICSTCPRFAAHCCLCTPERVYSCEKCISQHASKGGVHPLAPVSVPSWVTASTLPVFNNRLRMGAVVKCVLEGLSGKLECEKSQLRGAVDQRFQEQVKALDQAWKGAVREVEEYYERVRREIEGAKREIATLERQYDVKLSSNVEKLVQTGLHCLSEPVSFLDLAGEVQAKIKVSASPLNLPTSNCLQTLLQRWQPSLCHCAECQLSRRLLRPETLPDVLPPAKPPPLSQAASSQSPHRLLLTSNTSKSDILSALQRANATSQPSDASLPSDGFQAVRKVGAAITDEPTPTKTAKIDSGARPSDVTVCYKCGEVNSVRDRTCARCGLSTAWADYLDRKKVDLSPSCEGWKCSLCSRLNESGREACRHCGKANESATRRKGENAEGLFEAIGGFFKSLF